MEVIMGYVMRIESLEVGVWLDLERQKYQMEWLTHMVGEEVNKLHAHLRGENIDC